MIIASITITIINNDELICIGFVAREVILELMSQNHHVSNEGLSRPGANFAKIENLCLNNGDAQIGNPTGGIFIASQT